MASELYVPLYEQERQATPATVCVSGGSGFVAGPIIERLLAAGHTVRATVRDPSKEALLKQLKALPGAADRLTFHQADLLQPGSFNEVVQGCRFVIHTASPFFTPSKQADVRPKLLDPAIKGTQNVLDAVNAAPSVERVVLTSSVAAIYGDSHQKGADGVLTEDDWAEKVSESYMPYYYSKKLAEEKAWEMAKAQDRWQLVTINPSMVVGPPVGERADGESIGIVSNLFNGKLKVCPRFGLGWVDVRDVAAAHCLAMVHPAAQGRYICSESTYTMFDLGKVVKEQYPNQPVPSIPLPGWLGKLVGPVMGVRRDVADAMFDKSPTFSHAKIERELGFQFHPAPKAVLDMLARLIEIGHLKPK